MGQEWIAPAASVLASIFTLIGVLASNRNNQKVYIYRIEQLEKKQDAHNSLIERTFKLEGRMNEAEHDIRDLKSRK